MKQPQTLLLKDLKILVVDDEDLLAWSIDTELKGLGADIQRTGSVREALERCLTFTPDLVITDLRLPDGNGLELLKKWRLEQPELPIILITAHGAIDSAVTALRLGALDYLQKPFDMKDLIAAAKRAGEIAKLRQRVSGLAGYEAKISDIEIVGSTPVMLEFKQKLRRLAQSKANTVLILGESGTGKELAARAIHQWSEAKGQSFVEINCASIPETLLESELFGYEKGAFTDARERKLGLFEIGQRGSIFLDELGELPLKLQAKLLRVLEYRRFKRLGGTKDIEFSGRIIAATNRNLLAEVQAGRFRADLYYRLSALPIELPLLRERLEDLPGLAQHFVGNLANELGLKPPTISNEALSVLRAHSWPGNIRELKNVLQRALVYYEPKTLAASHLHLDVAPRKQAIEGISPKPETTPAPSSPRFQEPMTTRSEEFLPTHTDRAAPFVPVTGDQANHGSLMAPMIQTHEERFRLPPEGLNLDELERSLLVQALERSRHNQTKASRLLGISRHTLRYRLEKHGLFASQPPSA